MKGFADAEKISIIASSAAVVAQLVEQLIRNQ